MRKESVRPDVRIITRKTVRDSEKIDNNQPHLELMLEGGETIRSSMALAVFEKQLLFLFQLCPKTEIILCSPIQLLIFSRVLTMVNFFYEKLELKYFSLIKEIVPTLVM